MATCREMVRIKTETALSGLLDARAERRKEGGRAIYPANGPVPHPPGINLIPLEVGSTGHEI
jgi:hypothetical protein